MTVVDTAKTVRIGGASGAWGDSPLAYGQLLGAGVDYLMMDYLAEVTMSLLARARAKDPESGYVPDLVAYLSPWLTTLEEKKVKVVTNGGGLNPAGAARALQRAVDAAGLDLVVAAVEGDDVLPHLPRLVADGDVRAEDGGEFTGFSTANAYLGALPIRHALAAGADIVITGRCADSALALGILMHEYGWSPTDYDLLAAGSLVGHVLECGPQATGGTFTDWWAVPDWHAIGYPIAECSADGAFTLSKPAGTGGLIDPRCVSEQILYEVGDPAAYVLPDVIADFSRVRVERVDADHVHVGGARGLAPTSSYKVSATEQHGYRSVGLVSIVGPDASRKAQRTGEEFVRRGEAIFAARGFAPYRDVRIEVLGAESAYGALPDSSTVREVVLRVVTTHPDRAALETVAREAGSIGLGFAPGTAGLIGGRPRVTPQLVLRTLYVEKAAAGDVDIVIGERRLPVEQAFSAEIGTLPAPGVVDEADTAPDGDWLDVPLGAIAYSRSGDKGDKSNIAILARHPELLPVIAREVTPERMAQHFAGLVTGEVRRFPAPGLHAVNFLLDRALGGGGIASLRIDPQGKAFGQMSLEMTVKVPESLSHLLETDGPSASARYDCAGRRADEAAPQRRTD